MNSLLDGVFARNDNIDLSIVLPIFNERENLAELLGEVHAVLREDGCCYEIIAVDDGSTDGSKAVLADAVRTDSNLKVIYLRRNYGQAAAFDAGFRASSGKLVITMDADRQNDPRDIPHMIRMLNEEKLDFLSGRRTLRRDRFLFRKLPSQIANWLIRAATHTPIHDLGCSLKLYRREIVDNLRLYGEMHRFIPILVEGMGAKIGEIDVAHRPRVAGKSKYGLSRTFKVLLDLTTVWFMRGFETKPIYLFGGISFLMMAIAFALSGLVLWQKIMDGVFVHRNPLFMLSMVTAIMSVQFMALGLLAEVLIRTYYESQHKAAYLIGEILGFGPTGPSGSPVSVTVSGSVSNANAPVMREIKETVAGCAELQDSSKA